MIRSRASATLAIAGALASSAVSMTLAAPLAHASPLDEIAAIVKRDRPATCSPLVYNGALEGIAQDYARNEDASTVQTTGGYDGAKVPFLGSGDPQSRALTSAYERGAGAFLSKCEFTDFGVGFIRYVDGQPLGAGKARGDDLTIDVVTIVFGKPPAAPAPVPVREPDPVKQDTPKTCPEGSPTPTVPADGTCADAPPDIPPTDAVTMDVKLDFLGAGSINVKSSAKIPGTCTYDATSALGPPFSKTFNLAPNGSFSFTTPAKGALTYNLVLSCTGDFKGKSVEFGHVEKTV